MGLYIIQYISSSLDWESGQIFLSQRVEPVVSWDNRLKVSLTISPKNVNIIFYLSIAHVRYDHKLFKTSVPCRNQKDHHQP